jgi:hypothetical protein
MYTWNKICEYPDRFPCWIFFADEDEISSPQYIRDHESFMDYYNKTLYRCWIYEETLLDDVRIFLDK